MTTSQSFRQQILITSCTFSFLFPSADQISLQIYRLFVNSIILKFRSKNPFKRTNESTRGDCLLKPHASTLPGRLHIFCCVKWRVAIIYLFSVIFHVMNATNYCSGSSLRYHSEEQQCLYLAFVSLLLITHVQWLMLHWTNPV